MTASDLERSLAEARAAAARRLESLKRAEGHGQGDGLPPEPVFVARREPSASAGELVDRLSEVPQDQVVRLDSPPRDAPTLQPPVHQRVNPVATAPEPFVAYREPANEMHDLGQQGFVEATHHPNPGSGYVAVDPISRTPDEAFAPPLENGEARDPIDVGSADIRNESGFMARLIAGVVAYRRSRAERRALATVEPSPAQPRNQRLTAKEQRWERRRKRHFFEEILGWILVPIILVAIYFFALWVLELFGTTPEALIEGLQLVWSQLR